MPLAVRPSQLLHSAENGALRMLRGTDPRVFSVLAHRPINDAAGLVVAGVLPLRFAASRASGVDATIELRLPHAGRSGHASVTVRIADGKCRTRPRAATNPDLVVTARVDHLLQLVTGQASARAMLSDRRLRVSGDVLLFMRFPGMFGGLG